jgi:hypothetical protein
VITAARTSPRAMREGPPPVRCSNDFRSWSIASKIADAGPPAPPNGEPEPEPPPKGPVGNELFIVSSRVERMLVR